MLGVWLWGVDKERSFQAEGTAIAEAQRRETAWCAGGT